MKLSCERVESIQDEQAYGLGVLIFQGYLKLLLVVWVLEIRWNAWAGDE